MFVHLEQGSFDLAWKEMESILTISVEERAGLNALNVRECKVPGVAAHLLKIKIANGQATKEEIMMFHAMVVFILISCGLIASNNRCLEYNPRSKQMWGSAR